MALDRDGFCKWTHDSTIRIRWQYWNIMQESTRRRRRRRDRLINHFLDAIRERKPRIWWFWQLYNRLEGLYIPYFFAFFRGERENKVKNNANVRLHFNWFRTVFFFWVSFNGGDLRLDSSTFRIMVAAAFLSMSINFLFEIDFFSIWFPAEGGCYKGCCYCRCSPGYLNSRTADFDFICIGESQLVCLCLSQTRSCST